MNENRNDTKSIITIVKSATQIIYNNIKHLQLYTTISQKPCIKLKHKNILKMQVKKISPAQPKIVRGISI